MHSREALLFSTHFDLSSENAVRSNLVGQKGEGLFNCDPNFMPPFVVIPFFFFRLYLSNPEKAKDDLNSLVLEIRSAFEQLGVVEFIVRSSAKMEGFEERGFYESIDAVVSSMELQNSIIEALEKNRRNISAEAGNEFAVIIQQVIKWKYSGHLSNERRVSRNISDWLIEIVNEKREYVRNIKFNSGSVKIEKEINDLSCNTKSELIQKLKSIAANSKIQDNRFHFEWVWDGTRLWIVQRDVEGNTYLGMPPGSSWIRQKQLVGAISLKALRTVSSTLKNWKKMECIKTFDLCGLPKGEVYVLENSEIISELISGNRNRELTEDLEALIQHPITIRMDILKSDGYDGILLPRTETIFTLDHAYSFLMHHARAFSQKNVKATDFSFLIHRFIISKSCALAYAKPGIPRARIDSTWGIVDGLYYHPHDSFEFNLVGNNVKKRIRCKTEYLDVDQNGKWFSKKSGRNWDWMESLTFKELSEIAEYTTKISDFLNAPVTVMYFVDVDSSTGYPKILPWFYTTEEVLDSSEKFTDVIFSEVREIICSISDLGLLKLRVKERSQTGKFCVKLKLNPDVLREKHFIEDIGNFCRENNIPVELEGSILSHTYYILRKCGAKVKCVEPFEPKYKTQKFYKLVRDHIPINIESKGEIAKSFRLESSELLRFLKEKAIEEAFEFYWEDDGDKTIEELADLYEIIRSTCGIFGINLEELKTIADKKAEKKGGFEKGVFLMETSETALIEVVEKSDQSSLSFDFEETPNVVNKSYRFSRKENLIHVSENSISLPYVYPIDKDDKGNNIKHEYRFANTLYEVEYKPKNIVIKIRHDKSFENPSQLTLF